MTAEIPLTLQTAYAELVDRCGSDAFASAFPEDGAFTSKSIRGRRYWYFQVSADGARKQRYVGPETPELLDRIKRHKEARGDQRDRRALVSMLVRSARLPRAVPEIGQVVEALAGVGIFRRRAVLVGTVAYQTYSAMLGVRLPARSAQTGDVDIAQFRNVSMAIEDKIPVMFEVLKKVDETFRPIPHLHDPRRVTTYQTATGIRVDFLTPNEGKDTDAPAALPALGTDAEQLRFLDFLIYEPEPAVILHGAGVYVLVPAPHRYALHKLIVARRRAAGAAKAEKDIQQAEALLDPLTRKRPHELRSAWQEAFNGGRNRGKKWKKLMGEGLGLINPEVRDRTLAVVKAPRSIIPGLDLTFAAPAGRYDFDRDIVEFLGKAGGDTVRCSISREALEDHFGAAGMNKKGRIQIFRDKRSMFERMARTKYLFWPVEEPGKVLIKTTDVQKLNREVKES